MFLGRVERGEVVEIILDFSRFKHLETHSCKNVDEFGFNYAYGMKSALFQGFCRHGDVYRFFFVTIIPLRLAYLRFLFREIVRSPFFKAVDDHSEFWSVLFRRLAEFLHKPGDYPGFAQNILGFELEKFVARLDVGEFQSDFPFNLLNFFFHNFISVVACGGSNRLDRLNRPIDRYDYRAAAKI